MPPNQISRADTGSSLALQRWIEVLGEASAGRNARAGAAERAARAAAAGQARTEAARASRPDLVPEAPRAHPIDRAALDAHAALGELSVQRDTYAGVERAIAESGRDLQPRLVEVDRAYQRAQGRRAERTDRARDAASAARQAEEDARARADVHEAVSDAVRELQGTSRRLEELREAARLAVRETNTRVNALADRVASENGSRGADEALARRDDARDDARRVARREAIDRRDAVIRELGRLVGASASVTPEGEARLTVGDDVLVEGDRVSHLPVTPEPARTAAPEAEAETLGRHWADGSAIDEHSGTLAALVQARDRIIPEALDRLADLSRDFVDEVARRQGGSVADGPAAPPSGRAAGAEPPPLVALDAHGLPHVVGGVDDVVLPEGTPAAAGPPAAPTHPSSPPSDPASGRVPAAPAPPVVAAPDGAPVAGAPDLADASSVADAQGRFAAAAGDVLGGLLQDVAGRREAAERRLDVLTVVDSVLAGAPSSQVGGLVRAALGAVDAPGQAAASGQHLVSTLQTLNGLSAAMGTAAAPLVERVGGAPLVVTAGSPSLVVAVPVTPANREAAGLPATGEENRAPGLLGRFGGLLQAVGSVFAGEQPPPPAGPGGDDTAAAGTPAAEPAPAPPLPPFTAGVSVLAVARGGASVSETAFPSGHVLGGGSGFSLTLTEGVGTPAATARGVTIPPGTTMRGVVDALNGVAEAVQAQLVPAGAGTEKLLLTARRTGADTAVSLTDGRLAGQASSVLGPFRPLETASDTVVEVTGPDGIPVRTSSPTTTVDGALPGLRLTVGAGAAGGTAQVLVHPEADRVASGVAQVVETAGAVLSTLQGEGSVPPDAARAVADDPAVRDLAARIAAALTGMPTLVPGRPDSTAPAALPGVRVDAAAHLSFSREAFLRSYADDPVGVEAAVRGASRELTAVAREASDARAGFLAVRIVGEAAYAQEYSAGSAGVDEKMQYRQDVYERRAEAMQALLARLGDERTWLEGALAR